MKNKLKGIVAALALTCSAASFASVTATIHNEEVAVAAVKCMSVYDMLGSVDMGDDFGKNVLNSQAFFMSSLYLFTVPAEDDVAMMEGFIIDTAVMTEKLVRDYKASGKMVHDLLYQCEGWREDVIKYMADNEKFLDNATEAEEFRLIFTKSPTPKPNSEYNIEAVTQSQINAFVNTAMSKYIETYEHIPDFDEE